MAVLASPEVDIMPTVPRLLVPATLQYKTFSLPLSTLIDSGAEDNFIDSNLTTQAGFPIEPISSPVRVTAIDGHTLTKITHQTVPINRELLALKLALEEWQHCLEGAEQPFVV